MLYIGVDLGTSAVKLLLMQTDGTIKKNSFKGISAQLSKTGLVGAKSRRLVECLCSRHSGAGGRGGQKPGGRHQLRRADAWAGGA